MSEIRYDFVPGTQPLVLDDSKPPRYGVYAASFDPVHAGHIKFALQAQRIAGLERVYFVPERKPLASSEPEHYVHRSVMLRRALQPYRQFEVSDLPYARLNTRGMARMVETLPGAEFSLLTTASDLLWYQGELPVLYHKLHLVVAVVSHAQMAEVLGRLTSEKELFSNLTFIDISNEHISSTAIRHGIRSGRHVHGLLPSVWRYARKQWLYLPPIRHGTH